MITSTNIVPIIICMLFMIGTTFLTNHNTKNDLTTAVIIACGIVALVVTVLVCGFGYIVLQLFGLL